jgi:hypothetical protein
MGVIRVNPRVRWRERTYAATFEEFIEFLEDGTVRFANRNCRNGEPFLSHHWPVFSLVKRKRWRRRMLPRRDQIAASSWLCEARRWLPCSPLDAHAMKVEDARFARRRLNRDFNGRRG